MKRFLNIITRKYKDADGFIKAYQQLHQKVAESVDEYDEKIKNEEITRFHFTDISLTGGLKVITKELEQIGYQIDNVILAWIEKGDDKEWIGKYSAKLPKASSIPYSKEMLENEDVKVLSFPEFKVDDIQEYSPRMKEALDQILAHEKKVKSVNLLIEELKSKNLDTTTFEKTARINENKLSDYKFNFAQELSFTKIKVDKTLNFMALPTEVNIETVAIHTYLRKLVDTGFLSHEYSYKRYVDNKPSIISDYFDDLGLFYTKEEKVLKEEQSTENNEYNGSEVTC